MQETSLLIGTKSNRGAQWGYRPSIDGLRAIAVLSVIVFHFNKTMMSGGFVGVDVFFVISGYLLTSILLIDIDKKQFSISRFYQRRIARIFPAFFVVIAMALIFSSMIYSAQDFASLGANAAAAVFSAINIKLLFQGSYFKLSPDAQPILHYWSLAVEEQFYLLFPIYLFWIARFRRRLTINLLVCAASFVLCVIVTYHNAKYAFYLLPTRAWELLGGATLAIVERQHLPSNYRAASIASWTGLALLLVALFTIDPGGYFPGWIASLPVLGTILILSSTAHDKLWLTRVLSSRPAVAIGKLSYSLYLWHWSTFSLVDYQFFQRSDLFRAVLKITITVAASVCTYFTVEKPLRRYLGMPGRKRLAFAGMTAVVAVVFVTGFLVRRTEYFNASPAKIAEGGNLIEGGDRGKVVLVGDSQASMYGRDLVSIARAQGLRLNIVSVDGGNELPGEAQTHWPDVRSFILRDRPDIVIIVEDWPDKIASGPAPLLAAMRWLQGRAGHIVLLTQQPIPPEDASRQGIRSGAMPPFYENARERERHLKSNAIVENLANGWMSVINVDKFLLDRDNAIRLIGANGRLTYQDSGHLSDTGTALIRPVIEREIVRALGTKRHKG